MLNNVFLTSNAYLKKSEIKFRLFNQVILKDELEKMKL